MYLIIFYFQYIGLLFYFFIFNYIFFSICRNGSDVRGYFQWSFLDVFELTDGYESSFGLHYVDLEDPNLRRIPKLSAQWYSNFLKTKNVSSDGIIKSLSHHAYNFS